MPKKGGKKKNKGGKGPAAAAVDKVADTAKHIVHPGHEVEDKVMYGEGKGDGVSETPAAATQTAEGAAPELSTTTPATAGPAVTETKQAEKEAEKATPKEKGTLQETVDKAQASKAGQIGKVDGGDAEGTAVLPETISKEPSIPAETYPSTSEMAAEEPATSTAGPAGAAVGTTASKTPGSTAVAENPVEADAHAKRPYEKPIFSSDETKPSKMAKHEEEQARASAALDKKTLAGAGPASTAAYTTPEPVPVKKAEEPVKKAEEPVKKAEEPVKKTEEKKEVKKAEEKKDGKTKADGKASPQAVAAAAAAVSSSKGSEKTGAAAPEAELKQPEPALKKGDEPKAHAPMTDAVKEDSAKAKDAKEANDAKEEPKKTEAAAAAEAAEKKKGGFFSRLKRMFK
ncbi:hypothetical protein N7510_009357 [Penicillium lagena]|uniref:uncharacterized protein n=1 Tax=Penicillium lagena TaxID=94218 RepID=UPI00253FD713|nr:uncharacterized protein N7510_009357 [Penicillium lagena]KAJ5606576.1 hypothetical protein N7510_009357 [Penicillium lagena]